MCQPKPGTRLFRWKPLALFTESSQAQENVFMLDLAIASNCTSQHPRRQPYLTFELQLVKCKDIQGLNVDSTVPFRLLVKYWGLKCSVAAISAPWVIGDDSVMRSVIDSVHPKSRLWTRPSFVHRPVMMQTAYAFLHWTYFLGVPQRFLGWIKCEKECCHMLLSTTMRENSGNMRWCGGFDGL